MDGRSRERALAVLAVAWLAAVAVIEITGADLTRSEVGASPDTLADGALWRLLTSALLVESGLPLLQIALVAGATALVLVRYGAVTWWLAALAGHVGSALLAYAIIAVADALGSASADRFEDDWDFNQKFGPQWLPRSIVIDDLAELPRVALLYASVEGFLDVPLVGKLFVPPVRREADARAGAG